MRKTVRAGSVSVGRQHRDALRFLQSVEHELGAPAGSLASAAESRRSTSPDSSFSAGPRPSARKPSSAVYSLREDFQLCERLFQFEKARCLDDQARKASFFEDAGEALGRTYSSISKRVERLQKFNKKSRFALFFFCQHFPSKADTKRAALVAGEGAECDLLILNRGDMSVLEGEERIFMLRVLSAFEGRSRDDFEYARGLVEGMQREGWAMPCAYFLAFIVEEICTVCALKGWAPTPVVDSKDSFWEDEIPSPPELSLCLAASLQRPAEPRAIVWRRASNPARGVLAKVATLLAPELRVTPQELLARLAAVL